jgi:hypothetical protein
LFPVPGTTPPSANFLGGSPATAPVAPGTVLNNPGDELARALAWLAAFAYAAAKLSSAPFSTLNVDINC